MAFLKNILLDRFWNDQLIHLQVLGFILRCALVRVYGSNLGDFYGALPDRTERPFWAEGNLQGVQEITGLAAAPAHGLRTFRASVM